jgi:hypothetical protein
MEQEINILQRITEDFIKEWLMKRQWENLVSQESDHAGEWKDCDMLCTEARGKHKPCDSRGSVSAEKLSVIFSEEMRTSSEKNMDSKYSSE